MSKEFDIPEWLLEMDRKMCEAYWHLYIWPIERISLDEFKERYPDAKESIQKLGSA